MIWLDKYGWLCTSSSSSVDFAIRSFREIDPPLLASTITRIFGLSEVLELFSTAPIGFTNRPDPGANHSFGRDFPITNVVPAATSSARIVRICGANARELSWFCTRRRVKYASSCLTRSRAPVEMMAVNSAIRW